MFRVLALGTGLGVGLVKLVRFLAHNKVCVQVEHLPTRIFQEPANCQRLARLLLGRPEEISLVETFAKRSRGDRDSIAGGHLLCDFEAGVRVQVQIVICHPTDPVTLRPPFIALVASCADSDLPPTPSSGVCGFCALRVSDVGMT